MGNHPSKFQLNPLRNGWDIGSLEFRWGGVGGWGGWVGSNALLSSSPSLIWLQLGLGLAGAVTIFSLFLVLFLSSLFIKPYWLHMSRCNPLYLWIHRPQFTWLWFLCLHQLSSSFNNVVIVDKYCKKKVGIALSVTASAIPQAVKVLYYLS